MNNTRTVDAAPAEPTVRADEAVQLLRRQRAETAEQRASEIVQSVHQLRLRDLGNGDVARFGKTFNGTKIYTYAALKVVDDGITQWFVTGRQARARGMSDDELEEFLVTDGGFIRWQVASFGVDGRRDVLDVPSNSVFTRAPHLVDVKVAGEENPDKAVSGP